MRFVPAAVGAAGERVSVFTAALESGAGVAATRAAADVSGPPAEPPCTLGEFLPRSDAEQADTANAVATEAQKRARKRGTDTVDRGEGFGRNLLGIGFLLAAFAPGPRELALYFPAMRSLLLLPLAAALAGCGDTAHSAPPAPAPPAAEFVLAAGDSTYWVTSDAAGIRVRGAPIDLAQVGGRFFELYVVDNDLSFTNADLVGQSVYRRDLRTGDSTIVFTDSMVPELAREYAHAHPGDHQLGRNEEPDEQPALRATATLDVDAAHGPFVSYSLHTDVERRGAALWHVSRRGVIDLRSGRAASLSDVVGAGLDQVEQRRDVALKGALDSVRTSRDARGRRASVGLPRYRLDASSFSITTSNGGPAIAWALPGAGEGDAGHVLPLDPIGFAQPAWWRDVASSLPMSSADGSREVWRHGPYSVVVRYDSVGDAHLSLRDSTSREWPVAPISAPATHIFWLDAPRLDGETRHALARAFDEAAGYGADTKVAALHRRSPLFLASR